MGRCAGGGDDLHCPLSLLSAGGYGSWRCQVVHDGGLLSQLHGHRGIHRLYAGDNGDRRGGVSRKDELVYREQGAVFLSDAISSESGCDRNSGCI